MRVKHPARTPFKTCKLGDLNPGDAYLNGYSADYVVNSPKLMIVAAAGTGVNDPGTGSVLVFDPSWGVILVRGVDQMVTPVDVADLTYTLRLEV